jgi:hypothetical protein
METLHVDLNNYHAHFYKKLNFAVGTVLIAVGVWLINERYQEEAFSLWRLYLPVAFLLIGTLQILISNGYSWILGKMFFRIDQDKIEYKVSWLSKTKTLCWNSIEYIDVKMSQLQIKTKDGNWKVILLDHIPENEELRQIKSSLRKISKLKKIRVT